LQPASAQPGQSRPQILVVDDEPAFGKLCAFILDRGGLGCDVVHSGRAALEAIASRSYDLVLLDLQMPRMQGQDVLLQLRESSRCADIGIILFSGSASPDEMALLLMRGADDYLVKPFSPVQLLARVHAVLRSRKTRGRTPPPPPTRPGREGDAAGAPASGKTPLPQSQKLEAIGRLIGGVVHDFNNLLTVINGYSEILLADPTLATSHRDLLEQVRCAGDKATALTYQLLAFGRPRPSTPEILDLNPIVLGLDKMLRRLVQERIELVTLTHAEPVPVHVGRCHLEQVLMNLAVNACDAMPEGGVLTIQTAVVPTIGHLPQGPASAPARSWAVLSVRDTGCGMDEHTKARIFDPFFTTKGSSKGTGLGLATVATIIHQSNGHIDVETAPGQGTTFHIYLPITSEPTVSADRRPIPTPLPGGDETILVVEDEPGARRLTCTALRRAGYTVLEASYPAEALQLVENHPAHIALLITDMVLPQMSGLQLASRMRPLRPGVKVLFISGCPDAETAAGTDRAFLQKPFTLDALLGKTRQVLDSAGSFR
jgi:signal transduction histidine kinase